MAFIRSGFVTALYLFDVAQAIDMVALRTRLGDAAASARLDDKTPGPPRLRYAQPPVIVDGRALQCPSLDGFRVRIKFYDYGVISLMLSRPFEGAWTDLVSLGQSLVESEPLEDHATAACERIVELIRPVLSGIRATFLNEDYLVFAVTSVDETDGGDRAPERLADHIVERHGGDIAQLLRGERQALSVQEREEVLRHRLSYLSDDLVVPAWNAAFILDTEAGALATIEILEFANSQLLELRYHDDVLEAELVRLYAQLQQPRWSDRLAWRRQTRAVIRVQSIFIDVNELTDSLENAVKFVGDMYSARLFGNVAARLGLDRWKLNVEDKLRTLNDIRQFAVEQAGLSQANILELAIVFILVVELGLFFAGIMK